MKNCAKLIGLLALPALALAGPLAPPVGPVAPTGKTTQEIFDKVAEVEPRTAINAANTPGDADSLFKITQPGSYYLTGNVLGQALKKGIEIAAPNVTLDLNGFAVNGQAIGTSLDGIGLEIAATTVVVRNGLVVGWGGDGVDLGSVGGTAGKRVESIVARDNAGNGISGGDSAAIMKCTAVANGGVGIIVSSSATVVDCVARGNSSHGILVGTASTVENCTARLNNNGTGIIVGTASVARGCVSSENAVGMNVAGAAHACTANANGGSGFVGTNAMLTDCAAQSNGDSGFAVSAGSTVARCRSNNNDIHGFSFSTACHIHDNAAYSNGAGGIGAAYFTSGNDSRIERNAARGGDYGFWITGTRNLLVGNSSAGALTAAWEINANNVYGTIIDRSGAATAAVSGFSGASVMNTTDPHANFTH
ncbi:right-handed parallel beta-helix repeat-containing protein [Synechococcus sp. Cruz CV-v-12]|uniref:right-handed parallel beta-helix repeat-containing protein n=1 Tax=Synechococcus sp. Cruz CV-v-12 TaxID=2823728 RepID=UPI0020CDD196|nr:right-handed parallel beta-helix repeat-containing protein [Synechococcus sp. Cruz CV-v-12]MCP9874370.1 hypothetical protein [Synechococcus sp. Cruz CV-v-12]